MRRGMDMGCIVRWSKELSAHKAAWLLRGLYVVLPSVCFLPEMEEFSDSFLSPKWYGVVATIVVLASLESGLYLFVKGHDGCAVSDSGMGVQRGACFAWGVSVAAACESLYVLFQSGRQQWRVGAGLTGTFDNPAGLALCLCLSLPFVRYLSESVGGSSSSRICVRVQECLPVLGVLLSGSRTGLLCLLSYSLIVLCMQKKIRAGLKYICVGVACCAVLFFVWCHKQDSTSGRIFILERSWELISRKPWTGYGTGGFGREYMWEQARYFAGNPESGYAWLADEVRHPLNEFVLLWVDYGVAAPCVLLCCFVSVIVGLACRKERFPSACACALSSLFLFSCFSYPFKYPLSALVSVVALCSLLRPVWRRVSVQKPLAIGLCLCSIILGLKLLSEFRHEQEWARVSECSLRGWSGLMMPHYRRLYLHYKDNPYFLYNYAVEQFYAGRYVGAWRTAEECRKHWASYNLELLSGDICRQLERYGDALFHYRWASLMCPVRFAPLEGMYHVYRERGDNLRADSVSAVIRAKKIKVLSSEVIRIKEEIGRQTVR